MELQHIVLEFLLTTASRKEFITTTCKAPAWSSQCLGNGAHESRAQPAASQLLWFVYKYIIM